jgi:hypothetical protein
LTLSLDSHTDNTSAPSTSGEAFQRRFSHAYFWSAALASDGMPLPHGLPPSKIDRKINQMVERPTVQQHSHRLNGFYFALDVKATQKAVYLSDKHNQEDKTKLNGGIPRIQGDKGDADKMKSVLPKVHVSWQ